MPRTGRFLAARKKRRAKALTGLAIATQAAL
jgi:hypothetical protein